MEGTEDRVVIVGGGIAGLTTALGLHRLGIRSLVLESSDWLRTTGFALAIWPNAWKALDAVGIGDLLRRDHRLFVGLETFSAILGQQTSQRQFNVGEKTQGRFEMRCVQRKVLLETLESELPKGTIRYSSKVVAIEESGHLKLVHLADGSIIRAKVLIGCDGVNSAVAKWLGLNKPAFIGRAAIRSYANYDQGHGLEPKFFQLFGKGARFGVLPYDDTSVYWFFTWSLSPQDKDMEHDPVKMKQFVLSRLGNIPDNVREVFERTELDNLVMSPLRFRYPWEFAWGNISKGNVCVAGDAFHPMTPDLGQGGCAALEDGVVLARCLGRALRKNNSNSIEMELKNYAKERMWRGITLITAGFMVGYVQQGNNTMVSFLRDRFLSNILAAWLLKFGSFDCGNLSSA